jgi:RNA polymerase sigma-70 factor (ECF subfamily)
MDALPTDQRRTVELVYFAGLTINETAERMSVPLGTAKSRLRLAMGRLRQELSAR